MKLTFLGTGTSQGVPVIGSDHPVCLSSDPKDKRLRSSVLLETDKNAWLIDCGPDFRYQMLREGIRKLDGVLFTHEHSDHIAGLDDIRTFNFMQGFDMPVFASSGVLSTLTARYPYVFATVNRYPGAPAVDPYEIDHQGFSAKGDHFKIIKGQHGQGEVRGYRLGDLAYLTDFSLIPETEKHKLHDLKVLVINALRKSPEHHSHFTLGEALDIIAELQPQRAFLTHISHYMGFHDEVQRELPENVFLAYDGLKISC